MERYEYHEDGGNISLGNACKFLQEHTASQARFLVEKLTFPPLADKIPQILRKTQKFITVSTTACHLFPSSGTSDCHIYFRYSHPCCCLPKFSTSPPPPYMARAPSPHRLSYHRHDIWWSAQTIKEARHYVLLSLALLCPPLAQTHSSKRSASDLPSVWKR